MNINRLSIALFLSWSCISSSNSSAQTDWAVALHGGVGSSTPLGISLIADQSDNIYTVGSFHNTIDLDPSASDLIKVAEGETDLFIQKLYSNGNLAWAHSFGSSGPIGWIIGTSIAVDASNNIYIVGGFNGVVDFNPGSNVEYVSTNGSHDVFILKLDSNGNFMWVKSFGGPSPDVSTGIALDGLGNLYTVGFISGFANTVIDMNPNSGVENVTCAGQNDMYIQKLDVDGNFLWAKKMGAEGFDQANNVTIDNANNPIITGYFESTVDFDPNAGITNLTSNGSRDIHITKLDANGNLVWAKSAGASEWDNGLSLVHDDQDNVYVTGYFEQTVDFDPNSTLDIHSSLGDRDIFVLKLSENGGFNWAKTYGSSDEDSGNDIDIDNSNNIYVTGHYSLSANFTLPTGNLVSAGYEDIFIQKIDASGTSLLVNSFGGPGSDNGISLTVTDLGKIYATGTFQETADFDATSGTLPLTDIDYLDIFILKVSLLENVGISDIQNQNEISISPNPNNGEFIISMDNENISGNVRIEIINGFGQPVWISDEVEPLQSIKLKDRNPGVYFIKIVSDHEITVKKFVVR